ncbi:PAS domain-containing protein [Oceanomicrobium pacificus]|uniref:PAS domain-containing protein n=1 Tax=Oceanomicrobium pacificus TaxID=2692916 RepID=A0A6B0TNM0_9RHOB|nr:PAS domain-containing protein [Oceanomicrobium pacificus]MXU66147.1 PAS domain-containing protein [Oceanomicrobium pacificus]
MSTSPRFKQLLDHWNGLRAPGRLPRRSEIDPNDFARDLPDILIIERVRADDLRIRVAGTRLTLLAGLELRAMPAEVLFAPRDRTRFRELCNTAVGHPALVDLTLRMIDRDDRLSTLPGLVLPLEDDDGHRRQLLFCLGLDDVAVQPPVSFALADSSLDLLRGFERLPLPGFDRARPGGLSEPSGQFTPAPRLVSQSDVAPAPRDGDAARRRGHLRLVGGPDSEPESD